MKKSRFEVGCATSSLLEILEGRTLLSVAPPLLLPWIAGSAPLAPISVTPPTTNTVTSIGLTIHPVAGVQFVGDVGELKGLVPSMLPRLRAMINWGDATAASTTGLGQLYFDSAGLLHVVGTHTYAHAGTDAITISVILNPPAGSASPTMIYTINSQAVVAQNSVGGVTITPTVKVPFTGVVGNFSLPILTPVAGAGTTGSTSPVNLKFAAYISWGDSAVTTLGTVTQNTDGSYSVLGTHTYNSVGTFRITVTVTRQFPPVSSTPIAGTPLLPPGSGITVNPPIILSLDKIYSTAIVSAPAPISIA